MHTDQKLWQLLKKAMASETNLPCYKQLYELLREQILTGLFCVGTALPSSRILAKNLGISRNTALAALEQLCVEGYAAAKSASGIYVLPTAPTHWEVVGYSTNRSLKLGLSTRGVKISKQSKTPSFRGAFTVGIPDIKQFPFELWQRYVVRHLRNPKLDWLVYPQQGGYGDLRNAIAEYLRIARGISCQAEQVLITNGTQNSLQLTAHLLANPGDTVWLEDPGYVGASCAFHLAELNCIYHSIDNEGFAPPPKAWRKPPRLIYLTPSHQFPTGTIMTAARRRHLLALAAEHQTWLIEDDYDSEFRYTGKPLAAMYALAPEQVIYLGTFSKILFPALRIGYIVLPEKLVDSFRTTQARHHREPSYVVQNALADFIRDGHLNTHIRKMRNEYQARRDALLDFFQNELGDLVSFSGLETGMHLIMHLPSHIDDREVEVKAHQCGIIARALTPYFNNILPPAVSALLLGFGDVHLDNIPAAGKKLVEIFHKM